jgi:arylsulfatase A-like enzyme
VLFTNAHTAAPACNPSRAALLSGLRPSTTGVYNNAQPWRRAMPDAVTLPRYFKDHGYYVLGGGKIFH